MNAGYLSIYLNLSKFSSTMFYDFQPPSIALFWLNFFLIALLCYWEWIFFNLCFYWRIIALQNFVVFCQTLTWISHQSVQSLSCIWLFVSLWIAACQASLSITNSQSSLKLMSIESVMPSSLLILCCPLLFLPLIPPSIRVFSNESTLRIRGPSIGNSASSSVLPMNIQSWFPLGLTVWSPWCPRNSLESSPTPYFKSINYSVLSFLYSSTLISIHDHRKNHRLDGP